MTTGGSSKKKSLLKKTFRVEQEVGPLYLGGQVALLHTEHLLACSYADEIKIVDLDTGRSRANITGDGGAISALACHPSKYQIVSASTSLQIHVWDLSSLKESKEEADATSTTTITAIKNFKGHQGPIVSLQYDSSGTMLASGSVDTTVKVWNIENGYCTHNLRGHTQGVRLVRFHPDAQQLQLFSSSEDGTVRVWNLKSNRLVIQQTNKRN